MREGGECLFALCLLAAPLFIKSSASQTRHPALQPFPQPRDDDNDDGNCDSRFSLSDRVSRSSFGGCVCVCLSLHATSRGRQSECKGTRGHEIHAALIQAERGKEEEGKGGEESWHQESQEEKMSTSIDMRLPLSLAHRSTRFHGDSGDSLQPETRVSEQDRQASACVYACLSLSLSLADSLTRCLPLSSSLFQQIFSSLS